jgi:hypothetical protein
MAYPFDGAIEDVGFAGTMSQAASYNPLGGLSQLPGQSGAPGPYVVNPGQAISSYMGAFTPELMGNILGMERTYGPQFKELDLANLSRTLAGTTGLMGDITRSTGGMYRTEADINREFQIDQLNKFGYPAMDAYMRANPYLKSAMDRADALGGVSANQGYEALSRALLGGAPAAQNLTPQQIAAGQLQVGGTLTPERVAADRISAERIASGQVSAGQVGAGALGESLYQQALRAGQMSPLSQALQQRGLSMASAPGQLTPEEIRAATQGSREMTAGTGRLESAVGITGEALARAGAARQRTAEDIAMAQQINQQLLGAQQAGQQLATDVLRADIARQQANVGTALQAGTFNVSSALEAARSNQATGLDAARANQEAALRANLANQAAGMEAGKFNISNLQDVGRFNITNAMQAGMYNADTANRMAESNRAFNYGAGQDYLRNLGVLGTMGSNIREADRAYNLNQMGAYGNIGNAALGAMGYNQPPPSVALGMDYYRMGSTAPSERMFDPNAGINLALTNASNLSNYYSNIYAADQARAGAREAASASKTAGVASGVGSLLGGAAGAALIAL